MRDGALVSNNATCMLVTLFIATFDAPSGRLDYARAGHVPPWLRRSSGSLERLDVPVGPPLGLVEDTTYREATVALHPGEDARRGPAIEGHGLADPAARERRQAAHDAVPSRPRRGATA
jgi:hypothetical protein